ncbi:MAG TPA: HAD-IA family hydrolase, partial [Burkholderiales bacterium]|nr:HAD-IA family hydrolase [Burkholderiales bacterium]
GRAALEQALARFGLARWLRPIVTRDDVGRMKPDAEGVFAVLREWRLPADTVLFVGDSRADVLAARNSGLRVAIVRGGECGDSGLAGAQPDFMLTRLDEIPERCFGQQPARDLARVHLSGRRPGARAE